jgi:tetratricopeptide (TPR) repeat protein
MSLLRRLLSGTYRRGRIAEARGFYRDAAALYAASGAETDAARALAQAAERCESVDEAVSTYKDALRWTKPGDPLRRELLAHFGVRVLRRARVEGATTESERRLLAEAAEALTTAERFLPAADAWELLGDWERTASCLERAGEIERLEALLTTKGRESESRRSQGLALDAYRAALEVGARAEALEQLRVARTFARDDALLGGLIRDLEARRPMDRAVRLRIGRSTEVVCIGGLPVTLGREGPFALRGALLSRQHARVSREGEQVRVEDLESRNGTRIGGVPIASSLAVDAPFDLGLGDDVELRVEAHGRAGLSLRVDRGLDRGLFALASSEPIEVPGTALRVTFPSSWAAVFASRERPLRLDGRHCAAPIELLVGDVLEVDGTRVEVVA